LKLEALVPNDLAARTLAGGHKSKETILCTRQDSRRWCLAVGCKFEDLYERLRKGFFLSSMMNITDGTFCSERSRGCVMVQLGAYLAEPPAYGRESYFLPSSIEKCTEFLAEQNRRAKARRDVLTCLNLASPKLEWALEAADCFHRAGGDFLELNVHGGYEPYLRLGKVRAMVLPENRGELFRWVKALAELEVPFIVKFREGIVDDYSRVLRNLAGSNVFAVHFNVRDDRARKPDYSFVQDLKKNCPLFLLASGYVRSPKDAETLFDKGADMVGIAEPTISNPEFIYTIASKCHSKLPYLATRPNETRQSPPKPS